MRFKLIEFAKSRGALSAEVSNSYRPVIVHLVKVFLYRDSLKTYKHWCTEIAAMFNSISKLKGTNKYPNSKELYNWLMSSLGDMIPDVIKAVKEDYGDSNVSDTTVACNVEAYTTWLANELSLHGIVSNSAIYTKLNSLVLM